MYSENKYCKDCQQVLMGRNDKKFCNDYCRSNFHTKVNRTSNNTIKNINNALKRNRRILADLNNSGKNCISLESLKELGFKIHYFTHFDKTKEIQYCYDFATEIKENFLYISKL